LGEEAESWFERAENEAARCRAGEMEARIRRLKLEMEGKFEEARNPYFWDSKETEYGSGR
jgi:hypothetical protein